MKAIIDSETCDRRRSCGVLRVCPRGAVRELPGGSFGFAKGYVVDEDRCTGCGVCVRACPMGAVHMK